MHEKYRERLKSQILTKLRQLFESRETSVHNKAETSPSKLTRRQFMQATAAATGIGILNSVSSEKALGQSNQNFTEANNSHEQLSVVEQLKQLSETWKEYKLDELLAENIATSQYFSNPEEYSTKAFGSEYQALFQTIDFFVDVQKLVQTFQKNPEAALQLLESAEHIVRVTFNKIIFPMFSVLAKHRALPEEQREQAIAETYKNRRMEISHLDASVISTLLQDDEELSLSQLQKRFIDQESDSSPQELKSEKVGPLLYVKESINTNDQFTKTDKELLALSLNSLNEDYPGLLSISTLLAMTNDDNANASFSATEGALRINFSTEVFERVLTRTIDHETIGHGSIIDVLDIWEDIRNSMTLFERFANFDPRLLLQASKEKIVTLKELLRNKDFIYECSITSNFLEDYMSPEEQAILAAPGEKNDNIALRKELLQNLDEATFEQIQKNLPFLEFEKELGPELAKKIIEIVRKNNINFVALLDELLLVNKAHPESKTLPHLIQVITSKILHYHVDIHMAYCNRYCNLREEDQLGQSTKKYPQLMDLLTSVDVREKAALGFFISRVLVSQPFGAPQVSNQEILTQFADRRKVLTDYCEQELLIQFDGTKDWKVTQFDDSHRLVNFVLLQLSQLYKDFKQNPVDITDENREKAQILWQPLHEHLPKIIDNIKFVDSQEDDQSFYRDSVNRLVTLLTKGQTNIASAGFFDYCKDLNTSDKEISTYIESLSNLYNLYRKAYENGYRQEINDEKIENLSKYLLHLSGPLILSYEPETHQFNSQIFQAAKAYFEEIVDTRFVDVFNNVADSSKEAITIVHYISDEKMLEISRALKTSKINTDSILKTYLLPEGSGSTKILDQDGAKNAQDYLSLALRTIQETLEKFSGTEKEVLARYIQEIFIFSSGISLDQNTSEFFSYLIYRTKFAMCGVLDYKSIDDRLQEGIVEQGEVAFPKIGMSDYDRSFKILRENLPQG